jgi:ArsR family transcriptional regulator
VVEASLPGSGSVADVGPFLLQAAADPIRWNVLSLLSEGTLCVCKLQEQVPIAASLLSYHLKILRDAGLVSAARRGRWIDYTLAPDALDRLSAALPGASALTGAAARP